MRFLDTLWGQGKRLIFCLVLIFLTNIPATAQVTPNELSRLSLGELLSLRLSDITDRKKWAFSYEYQYMDVGKYQKGRTRLSFDDILFEPGETRTADNFPIVPTFIKQEVHAFSLGREITDNLSISITTPLVWQRTKHISSAQGFEEFTLESNHLGDISVFGQYRILKSPKTTAHTGIGISLPTGSINEVGDTPRAGPNTLERLPYTMQIGSGTHDFLITFSAEHRLRSWAIGGDADTTLRTGKNSNGYRLGNNYGIETFLKYKAWPRFQPAIHLSYRATDRIKGRDESLLIPGALFPFGASITDPKNFGGDKAKIGASFHLCAKKDCSFNITIKGSVPIYQNLKGIQPRERFNLSTALNFGF